MYRGLVVSTTPRRLNVWRIKWGFRHTLNMATFWHQRVMMVRSLSGESKEDNGTASTLYGILQANTIALQAESL